MGTDETQASLAMETPGQPLRPTEYDEAVRIAAAKETLPALREWLQGDPASDAELIADLAKVLRRHDGYERAREFERMGYSPNSDLVDILSGASCYNAARTAVASWVEANGIKPQFAVGARVKLKRGGEAGTISTIDEPQAQYLVLMDVDVTKQNSRRVLDYEDVEAEEPGLWCCHIKGPDDVIACADKGHALRLAHMLNKQFGPISAETQVMFEAEAMAWPHSAEAHHSDLVQPSVDYLTQVNATRDVTAWLTLKIVPMVDRSKRTLTDGSAVTDDHRQIQSNGQQKGYVVLSAEERAKGYVRPVRRTYLHLECNRTTTMAQPIAETYARDPGFYSGTFCSHCVGHFPVGAEGEFVWEGTTEKVGT